MIKILFSLLILMFVSGCATIVEFDPEHEEMEQIRKIKNAQAKVDPFATDPTPDVVRLGEEADISVFANRRADLKGPNDIKLQTWGINVINNNDDPKCITIVWKLMDFNFDTNFPDEFYIPPKETMNIGIMRQTLWDFDGYGIALPPSGYVQNMRVRDINLGDGKTVNKNADEMCLYPEDSVEEM